jgi:lysophospholipase II
MGSKLGHVKFVLPTAPTRPVTLNMGHRMNAWYDITQLNDRTHDPNEGIEESATYIRSLIETEMEKTGLSLSRIALAGFSQGGAMSLFTGLQDKYIPLSQCENDDAEKNGTLAGVLVMSGYLPNQQAFQLGNSLQSTPVFHCHGTEDPVVSSC